MQNRLIFKFRYHNLVAIISTVNRNILYIIILFLVSCSPAVKYQKTANNGTNLNKTIHDSDSLITMQIAPYKARLDSSMNEVLNTSELIMERSTPEGHLGNFVADLCIEITKQLGNEVDFCLLNNGGLRVPLPKGDITRGKLFELMPFENELVILTLNKEGMSDMFKYIGSQEGIPISKELQITYKNWSFYSATISGETYDSTKTYKVVTSDYLARGGDKMDFFSKNTNSENINIKLRDAIISYTEQEGKANRPITAKLDERIKNAE
jgi:2',3'-cyclic-nucleotide 2'-phosphodiesterase (5'-nucleotidase family)